MGFRFSRSTGFGLDSFSWPRLFNTAIAFGWEPEGTTHPIIPCGEPGSEWDGSYFVDAGQRVSSVDALALANALLRAIDAATKRQVDVDPRHFGSSCDTRDTDPEVDGSSISMSHAGAIVQEARGYDFGNESDLKFVREDARYVLEFIDFLRGGAFRIY